MSVREIIKNVSINYKSFEEYLFENRTYGLSMVLIEDNEISDVFSYSLNQHIDSNTIFQAASMSKSIFAATVMRLNELGFIDIDRDITSEIMEIIVPFSEKSGKSITFKELLNHTAGLNVHGFSGYLHGQEIPSLLEIIKGVKPSNSLKLKLTDTPNVGFSYSGGGYVLAQYLIEKQTNKSYEEWAKELVFTPLDMKNSLLSLPIDNAGKNRIANAWSCHDTPLDNGYVIHPELAAAGLWTTPSDLAIFGIEMMKALEGKSNWLSQSSAKLMIENPIEISADSSYGLGFQMLASKSGIIFGHGGHNIGYHGQMVFCPEKRHGLVVMINSEIGADVPTHFLNQFVKNISIR